VITNIQNWVIYLQNSSELIGVPLLLVGVVLALGGWRIRKVTIPASFGLIGGLIGMLVGEPSGQEWLYALLYGVVLGVAGHVLGARGVGLLGGLIGAGIVNCLAEHFGLEGAILWVVTLIGLSVFTAVSFLDVRQVVILITSFEGAVLVVSACVAFFSSVPWVANQFRGTAWGWALIVPFLLLVPTVIGTLLQTADARQSECGIIGS
jgi:hypothetical protein